MRSRGMIPQLAQHLTHFVTSDRGAVTVSRIFSGAMVIFLGLGIVVYAGFGVDASARVEPTPRELAEQAFREANAGRDRATVLAEGPRQFFSSEAMRRRYEAFSNTRQTTDDDVRNAHRTWMRRVADHAYSQPGRAADMVLILENALEVRGLEPHRNI